ncbi:hypothetical protein Hanom_Chr14g01318491 [Helianthus anomalus]
MLAGVRRNCRSPPRNHHTITILNTSPFTNPTTLSPSLFRYFSVLTFQTTWVSYKQFMQTMK